MAEWSNAAVLKTVDLHGSGGSNPSSSANRFPIGSLFFLCGRRGIRTPGPARPTNLFLVYSVNTLTTVRFGTGPQCKWKKKSLRISASSLNSQFSILNLLGDIDLVDLGLSAGGTGEEVLGCDDCGAFITLDLLYPELHC